MKDLPSVYVSPIHKEVKNNTEMFYSKLLEEKKQKNIVREIDRIFHASDFVYKSRVEIETKEGKEEYVIIGKTSSSLLTLDGQRIAIDQIIDIKKL